MKTFKYTTNFNGGPGERNQQDIVKNPVQNKQQRFHHEDSNEESWKHPE